MLRGRIGGMAGGTRCRYAVVAVAATGVLAGHRLTYLADVPDAGPRASLLAGTGHQYLSVAGELVSALLAISIAAVFLGGLMNARTSPTPGRTLASRLVLLQIGAFVAMEVLERSTAGVGLGHLLDGGILVLGIAINVGVALVGAVVLWLILRLADRVAATISSGTAGSVSARASLPLMPLAAVQSPRHPSLGTLLVRGPPSTV